MTFIIAEIGVNHAGRLDFALRLIEYAAECGADAAKFQLYDATELAPGDYKKRAMLKGLALTKEEMTMCAAECAHRGIEFMCTPMGRDALHWLTREMPAHFRPKRLKIGSAQAGDVKFVSACAATGWPLVISNGMMTDDELLRSLEVCAADTTVLYCVSKYPTPQEDVDVAEIRRLQRLTGKPVGISSHCPLIYPTVAAVYAGAVMTENHLAMPGTTGVDVPSSLLPVDFKRMVEQVRKAG